MITHYQTITYLIILKSYVPNINGFDEAFSHTDSMSLNILGDLILHPEETHTVYFRHYTETIDFLDGNDFKVEGNDTEGYTISLV